MGKYRTIPPIQHHNQGREASLSTTTTHSSSFDDEIAGYLRQKEIESIRSQISLKQTLAMQMKKVKSFRAPIKLERSYSQDRGLRSPPSIEFQPEVISVLRHKMNPPCKGF